MKTNQTTIRRIPTVVRTTTTRGIKKTPVRIKRIAVTPKITTQKTMGRIVKAVRTTKTTVRAMRTIMV